MINSKYYQAQEDGIEVSMSFFLDLDKLNMNIYEFSKMFVAFRKCSQFRKVLTNPENIHEFCKCMVLVIR